MGKKVERRRTRTRRTMRLEDLPAAVWKENVMPFMEFWEVYPALAANKSLVRLRPLVSEFELNKAVADLADRIILIKCDARHDPLSTFEKYKVVATATAPRNIEALVIFGDMLAEGGRSERRASPALAARALHLALAYETFPTDDFPCHIFSDATAACDHARYRLALLHRDGLGVVQSYAIAHGYLETVIERATPLYRPRGAIQVHYKIPFAMRALGELVRYSDDVTPAAARRAIELMERAFAAEDRSSDEENDACYGMGLCDAALAAAGEDEDGNHARAAARYFHASCRSIAVRCAHLITDGPAAYELGRLFEEGIGVPQSRDGALLLFQVAANSGEDDFYRPMRSLSARLAENDAWMSQPRSSIETIAMYYETLSDAVRLWSSAMHGDGDEEFGPSDLAKVRALDGGTGGAASCIFDIFTEGEWVPP